MGVWTSFLNLFKPDRTEDYNVIIQQNDNWDKIDSGVKAVSDDLGNPSSASAVTGADAFSKIATLNSNIRKVNYQDYEIPLTSSSGRTVSVAASITGYFLIGASFVHNDDFYYLTVTDGIYPVLEVVDGTVQYIQLLGMNKQFNQVGANRTIKVRALYTKS